jgi:hypothetical protein
MPTERAWVLMVSFLFSDATADSLMMRLARVDG